LSKSEINTRTSSLPDKFTMVDGCFDPIHPGHILYFEEAKKFGFPVVCLVSTDEYVSRKHQPLLNQKMRIEVLSAQKNIDFVIASNNSTSKYLRDLRPTVYFKGGDWKGKLPLLEVQICEELGIQVEFSSSERMSSSELLRSFLSSQHWDSELDKFEQLVSEQESPDYASTFDDTYFTEEWRDHGESYSLESRREIEGRNPELINSTFRPKRLLDAGCGPGALLTFLSELGLAVQGIDASPAVLNSCSDEIRHKIQIGEITNMNFEDQNFDLVICREVFEHLLAREVSKAVQELCRVSSRYVYLTTRFSGDVSNLFALDTELEVDPTHITCLNQTFLRSLFVLQGFRRRRDLEEEMDWLNKNRVLVYERSQTPV